MSWYLSPSGHPTFADGPGQAAALVARGYTEISEEQARELVAGRAELVVDRTDVAGTFDDDTVQRAVRDEAPTPRPRRRKA